MWLILSLFQPFSVPGSGEEGREQEVAGKKVEQKMTGPHLDLPPLASSSVLQIPAMLCTKHRRCNAWH